MREILFRGKNGNEEWVQGDLLQNGYDYETAIWEKETKLVTEVLPESVSEFTGLTDKNGRKIFEGDIVKVCRGVDVDTGYVLYDERMASYSILVTESECLLFIDWFIAQQEDDRVWIDVIGNIHDNSELLKGEK